MNIDWEQLRGQKSTLLGLLNCSFLSDDVLRDICGVVNLLDAIQDLAVETGQATDEEVFGNE